MQHEKIGVGIVGAGNISDQYLSNLTTFPDFDVIFVADLDRERAASQAKKWGVPASGSLDELLANDQIQLVINLTIPAAHVPVSLAALNAGKHVWSEKPMALDRSGAAQLLEAAKKNGVRLGIAPDTFLGAGVQTGLNAIRGGSIGKPLTALTIFQTAGPDSWHPDPAFLFAKGAGPLFDMGPYYVTTLGSNLWTSYPSHRNFFKVSRESHRRFWSQERNILSRRRAHSDNCAHRVRIWCKRCFYL